MAPVRAQFGRPTGLPVRIADLIMAHPCSDRRRNALALWVFEVRRDDLVLEIGFGPGIAIRELSRIATEGYVSGLDQSELLLRKAGKRSAGSFGMAGSI